MLGALLTQQVQEICLSFNNGRRVVFDPRPLLKSLNLSPQAKMQQVRNVKAFLNGPKYKSLMKQLQKELDVALTK